MRVIRSARSLSVAIALRSRLESYRRIPSTPFTDPSPAREWQLRRFNQLWAGYCDRIPYYRDLARGGVPRSFRSWKEFDERVPPLTKALVRERSRDLQDPLRAAEYERVTGGSTGEPTRMAEWHSARRWTMLDKWMGRAWWGVTPADSVFMIWGHSHTLNRSTAGRIGLASRKLRDSLLGTYRLSAYDLGSESLAAGLEALFRMRPRLVIGYSGAIEYIARAAADLSDRFSALKMKGVLATGEQFMTEQGPKLVTSTFGAPLMMEYGSVETDVVAYCHPHFQAEMGLPPGAGYRVFWQSYLLEARCTPGATGPALITSLFPRCTPLVRYEIGDRIETLPGHSTDSLLFFRSVVGRMNEMIQLPDSTQVHTMAIKHCVEHRPEVVRFQMARRNSEFVLRLDLSPQARAGGEPVRSSVADSIMAKLRLVNPQLASTRIAFDEQFELTAAGKLLSYVDHDKPAAARTASASDYQP